MSFLLGIDIGTSSTKAVIIDEAGTVCGCASECYEMIRPQQGWAEQAVEKWWLAVCNSVRAALAAANCPTDAIAGIGLSGQMHGTVMLDAAMHPVSRAIIWQDNRSAAEASYVLERLGKRRLSEMTCNPLAPGFMAATILWMISHQPQTWENVRQVLLPKDYIRMKMTGIAATDPSDACGTSLFNTAAGEWNAELCAELAIDPAVLPPVIPSCSEAGRLLPDAASELGLPAGVPVAAGGGDLAMDAIGTGVVRPRTACSNIGTGGQFFVVSDRPVCDPELRVHTWCHSVAERWINTGVVLSAGASLAWFCSKVAGYGGWDEASADAASVPSGAGGLLFLPYLSGTRTPVIDSAARGVFAGLHCGHDRASMARSVMEGVVFALREGMDVITELGVEFDTLIVSGGGARSELWRQIQADIFNRPVKRALADEQAAFGAALCAGVAAGVYSDVLSACKTAVRLSDEVIQPNRANAERYEYLFGAFRRLYADNRETFRMLASGM